MLQAIKLPENATNFRISSNKHNRILNYNIFEKSYYKPLITNEKYETCNIVGVAINNELVYFNTHEIEYYFQDCIKMQVTAPVLVFLNFE